MTTPTAQVYIIAAGLLGSLALGAAPAEAQLLPNVVRDLPVDTRLDERLRERTERAARDAGERTDATGDTVEGAADEADDDAASDAADAAGAAAGTAGRTGETAASATQALGETGASLAGVAAAGVDALAAPVEGVAAMAGAVAGTLRPFVPAAAPDGSMIEANTVVALVNDDDIATLRAGGYTLLAARPMAGLGRTLVTLRPPAGAGVAATLGALRKNLAGATVDYNHVYRADRAELPADAAARPTPAAPATAEAAPAVAGAAVPPAAVDDRLTVGVIDSAVQAGHRGLTGIEIVAADFVAHDAARPETHGTAVASLIAKSADGPVRIVAASVFFQVPGYAPGATTESLVAALDWLAAQDVGVINMSLSGPGNALLEAAVLAVRAQGRVVVAAVGNDGPSSPPLYPAAYDGVIGVTAVDREHRVFRAANRGDYVDFAALGVDLKVADCTTGGYRLESGTSMAAPHVAVVAAELLDAGGVEPAALASWLIAGAEDLGRKGFDSVYGHGLVTRPPVVATAD